jgi:hypothetical protein
VGAGGRPAAESASACRFSTPPGQYGVVEVVRVALVPFGDVDPETIDGEPGIDDWHDGRRQAYDACREEIAALLGEPELAAHRLRADGDPLVPPPRSGDRGGDQRLHPVGICRVIEIALIER